MPVLETGTFVFLNILAFGTMLFALKPHLPLAPALHVVSMVLFFGLSLVMTGGFDIATENLETTSDGVKTWNTNSTDVFISMESAPLFNWVYFGFGVLAMILFIIRWRDK